MFSAARILIAHDDPNVSTLLTQLFTQLFPTASLVTIPTGDAALSHIQTHGADLLLVGIGLPGIDGLTLIRTLRALGVTTPIVLLSAADDADSALDAMLAGATAVLLAPFDQAQVQQLIDQLAPPDTHNSPPNNGQHG